MKNKLFYLLVFFFNINSIFSQENINDLKKLEIDDNQNIIIYCNSTKNTNLFFASSIENATMGNKTFQFDYDYENNGKLGIIKGTNGPETNLLVTTKNGDIFSFIIRFKSELVKFNYFIKSKDRIGNMNESDGGEVNTKVETTSNESKEVKAVTFNDYQDKKKSNNEADKNEILINECKSILNKGSFYKRYYAEATNVKFHLSNIVYKSDDLYFLLTLENNSSIDYEINDLTFNISAANVNKVTSTQKIKIDPFFDYNTVSRVDAGTTVSFIYVIKKFTINKEKKVEISLSEVTGERDLVLELSNKYINNPNLN